MLRHTAASLMYQHGATLKEISDVLGHQSLDTTSIYAKVNWTQLRTSGLALAGGAIMKKKRKTMMAMANEYLRHRRKLGYQLDTTGKVLLNFAR